MQINQLTQYKNNAKIHTDIQIQQIEDSIRRFGFNDPIAVWGEENLIIEGHGRYLACLKMGCTEIDVIRLDHLSNDERKAYTLAHNKLNLNTGFDLDKLEEELASLNDINFDMSQFGFEFDKTFKDETPVKAEKEIMLDEFGGQIYENECPNCGFEFN